MDPDRPVKKISWLKGPDNTGVKALALYAAKPGTISKNREVGVAPTTAGCVPHPNKETKIFVALNIIEYFYDNSISIVCIFIIFPNTKIWRNSLN